MRLIVEKKVLKEGHDFRIGDFVVWYDGGVGKDWGRVLAINSNGTVKVRWDDGKTGTYEPSNLMTERNLDEYER